MDKKYVHMYCGTGGGKSSAAIGRGIKSACAGKTVFVVQFLKGKAGMELDFLKRLEPEIKVFNFDKFQEQFSELNEDEKQEEIMHIRNGLNFAKKVLVTSECDVLILDEILGLPQKGIIAVEDMIPLIEAVGDGVELIMTGISRCKELWPYVDEVTEVLTDYRADTDQLS
ncbi:MAG: cob(I)yrinic acid a,c-diamide adenosyltransferase [Lachnospiraceae bacterium]|nr:cob(I)yrinic acid a,c-diamide adenosyltransferase [Lachnospiraceae bacterium]MDD3794709.1 cob(I)yrinic acid a,c-diamide adenosyltransferase [Lachnospiraceae bacterium]